MEVQVVQHASWRRGARVVAWLNMICMTLAFIWAIVEATLATIAHEAIRANIKDILNSSTIYNQTKYSYEDSQTKEADLNYVLMILWIILAIRVICSVVDFWAAMYLLSATKQTAQAKDSLRKCKVWLTVTVVVTILGIIYNIWMGRFVELPIGILIPVIFMLVVLQFMFGVKSLLNQK